MDVFGIPHWRWLGRWDGTARTWRVCCRRGSKHEVRVSSNRGVFERRKREAISARGGRGECRRGENAAKLARWGAINTYMNTFTGHLDAPATAYFLFCQQLMLKLACFRLIFVPSRFLRNISLYLVSSTLYGICLAPPGLSFNFSKTEIRRRQQEYIRKHVCHLFEKCKAASEY